MKRASGWPKPTPISAPARALLVFRQEPFRKTHNLKELGEACLTLDASLPLNVGESFRLSEYAWTS